VKLKLSSSQAVAMMVENPSEWAVFLDLDGTLIDIAPTPGLVSIPSDLAPLLARLCVALRGALAIVTGRPIVDLDRFLNPLRLITAGVHGAELRTERDGQVLLTVGPMDPGVAAAVSRLSDLAPGIVVEPKIYSIAVHYRLAPSAEPQLEAALKNIVAGSPDHFILSPGRYVVEVVPRRVSKGAALEAMMALAVFKGRRPIMIGDDVPDESALDAAVRHGGFGLRVAGEHFTGQADFRDPSDVRSWLAALADNFETELGKRRETSLPYGTRDRNAQG
jgi:trehalose 6-phosphate phosphatase